MLADTHVRTAVRAPGPPRRHLPAVVWQQLEGTDVILHAGDILDAGVLDILGQVAPVHAVLGNNDLSLVGTLPTTLALDLAGVKIAMVHDSGPSAGRAARLYRRFPQAAVVVFGHSHVPVNEIGQEAQLLFNPGSPTQRRAQPVHTMGELLLADGAVVSHRIIALDSRVS